LKEKYIISDDDYKVRREMIKLKERSCKVRSRQLDGSSEDPMINKKYKLPDDQLIKLTAEMI